MTDKLQLSSYTARQSETVAKFVGSQWCANRVYLFTQTNE